MRFASGRKAMFMTPILLDANGSFNLRYSLGLRNIIWNQCVDLIQLLLLSINIYCSLRGLLAGKTVIVAFYGAAYVRRK